MIHRLKRALAALVAVATLLATATPALAEIAEFGVLYIGNFSDADAREVRETLLDHGWQQEVFKSSQDPNPSMWPTHEHFTHGPDDKGKHAGDEADLLYVSGHGWPRAIFPIYRYGDNSPVDSISPDTNCTNASPNEIGVEWKGLYPSNESRWDNDIEWAIFAACSQLDWRTPPESPYAFSKSNPSDSSAKTWARTLLGEPRRMHSILGYWGIAPAGNTDTAIVRSFLYRSLDLGHSVPSAWMEANQPYGVPWAFLTHAENRWDRLHGVGTGARPDTGADDPFRIDYYRYGVSKRVIDGRGGQYEQMSSLDGVRGWLDSVVSFFQADTALADPPLELPDQAARAGLRLSDRARARGAAHLGAPRSVTMRRVDGRSLVPRAAEIRLNPGASDEPREVRVGVGRGDSTPESVIVWPSGLVEYHAGRDSVEDPVAITSADAMDIATEFLSEKGLLPEDSLVADVWAVTRTPMDLDSSESGRVEVLRYDVRLAQRLDGLLVDGDGAGIVLSVDAQGVSDMSMLWFETEGPPVGRGRRPMDGTRALGHLGSAAGRGLKIPQQAVVEHMDLVYRPVGSETGLGAVLRPAWRVEFDDGGAVHVDGDTGDVFE